MRSGAASFSTSEPAVTAGDVDDLTGGAAPDRYLTSQQVADRYQVSKDLIEQMARAGEIPARQIGRFWRYRLSDLERWWDES